MKGTKKIIWAFAVAVLTLSLMTVFAAAEGTESSDVSFAGRALSFVREHLPALLSGMTLLGVAVLAHAFKGGLLPILERGLGKLGGGVETVTDEAKRLLSETRSESEQARAEMHVLTEAIKADGERFSELESGILTLKATAIEELKAVKRQNETLLEMLKEVFTAARLPAASKMALEEMYERSRREKSGGGE